MTTWARAIASHHAKAWCTYNQGKNGTFPIITAAMDKCDMVKTRHLISYEWLPFPQNCFWCFKVECLVISIIKKKSEKNKAL